MTAILTKYFRTLFRRYCRSFGESLMPRSVYVLTIFPYLYTKHRTVFCYISTILTRAFNVTIPGILFSGCNAEVMPSIVVDKAVYMVNYFRAKERTFKQPLSNNPRESKVLAAFSAVRSSFSSRFLCPNITTNMINPFFGMEQIGILVTNYKSE